MRRVHVVVLAVALVCVLPHGGDGHAAGYGRGPRIPTPYQSLASTASDPQSDGPALKTRRAFFPESEDDGDNHHDGGHSGQHDEDAALDRPRDSRRLPGGPHDQEALLLGLLAHKQGNSSTGMSVPDNPRGVQGSLMDMLSKSEYEMRHYCLHACDVRSFGADPGTLTPPPRA